MIKIGITGTIGSGKTFALNFFKSKRIKTFSADFEVKNINFIKRLSQLIQIKFLKKR